jgi:hypothetical protein
MFITGTVKPSHPDGHILSMQPQGHSLRYRPQGYHPRRHPDGHILPSGSTTGSISKGHLQLHSQRHSPSTGTAYHRRVLLTFPTSREYLHSHFYGHSLRVHPQDAAFGTRRHSQGTRGHDEPRALKTITLSLWSLRSKPSRLRTTSETPCEGRRMQRPAKLVEAF